MADFKASDLQIAKYSSGFAMLHRMGLANIKMATGTAGAVETLTLDGNTTAQKYTSTASSTFYALDEFENNLPYKVGTRNTPSLFCYFIVNPDVTYTFGTSYKYSDSDTYRQWNNFIISSSSNTLGNGEYKEITTTTPKFKNLGRLYSYQGTSQTYSPILTETKYKMECWGASGGDATYSTTVIKGGRGGYTCGWITLKSTNPLYLYVGEAGSYIPAVSENDYNAKSGTYNGGGAAQNSHCVTATGGGATDIRIVEGTGWNDFESLKSRIMVAAGGGGGNTYRIYTGGNAGDGSGGHAGGITGGNGTIAYATTHHTAAQVSSRTPSTGGTQTSGGNPLSGTYVGGGKANSGKFGFGGSGSSGGYRQGGGSGYYGGGAGAAISGLVFSGAGGSSFISGYSGCNAINYDASTSLTSISHSGNSVLTINSKSYTFAGSSPTAPTMISGNNTMPSASSANGNETTGHTGNGYCRITIMPYD